MNITKHYLIRANTRFGLNENAAIRLLNNAMIRGKRYEQLESREKKYLYEKGDIGNCIPVYYQEKIFIFTCDFSTCLTVYLAPDWFGKKRQFLNKTQIKNPKKFLNYSPDFAAISFA